MTKNDLGQRAKEKLKKFIPEINAKLEEYFEKEADNRFGFNGKQQKLVAEIQAHLHEFLFRPQKKLRPSFVYYGYLLGGKPIDERVWKAAVAVDLVSDAALLIQDDFMDQDTLRRGHQTTHVYFKDKYQASLHFGEVMAECVMDVALCWGFELMAEVGNTEAMVKLVKGIKETAYGQAFDVTLEQQRNWTEDDVITLHKAKTAIYTYENPLFVGSFLAGLPEQVRDILHEYAMAGGVAFQLQDDILGMFGEPEKTGKSANSDLLEGKCTLLTLKLLETGTEEQKRDLMKVWGKGKDGNESVKAKDLELAKKAIVQSGAYEYSINKAKELAWQAASEVAKLNGLGLNKDAIEYIQGIAEYMVEREV